MKTKLEKLQRIIDKSLGEQARIQKELKENQKALDESIKREKTAAEAKELVLSVAKITQANIGDRISELVSLALAAIWEDPYEFIIDFVEKRGATEADLWFSREGNQIEPLAAAGGGVADVASIALRLAIWSLNKTSPIFILDEPFRNLHGIELNEKASLMLKELSQQLGLQIIMAAADDNMVYGADNSIKLD